ncbi:MAG: hypothetical protein E7559_02925 [Ruminococcaceae bacterium]|nr:hypothetical protein [Oscillospiraceae bacterium]
MKITEIWAKCFGMLRGAKLTFREGVNIIYGENETGKTSLMEFILAMFYGIGKGEERRRYEPWEGGRLDGVITFEHDDKKYTLSRQFGPSKSADKISLWCNTTGEPINIPARFEPGEHVFGINRETFINSVFIGQAGIPIRGDNNEILAKLTNLAASGDETASRTEIAERLNEASAILRSRRANAILPALEKQRLELIEQRQTLVTRSAEADTLREEVTKLTHRCQRLTSELADLEARDNVIEQLRKLRELEEIIRRKKSMEEAKSKYDALHGVLYAQDNGFKQGFLQTVRERMEQYNTQKGFISAKQEQYDDCCRRIEEFDRSPLSGMRTIKKYNADIQESLEQYRLMRDERFELERELEERPAVRKGPAWLTPQNVYIVCGALVILFVMLGFINPLFYVFAGLSALVAGAYFVAQRTGIGSGLLPSDNIQLANLDEDIHDLNRQMRPVLDEVGVRDMEELDRLVHYMNGVSRQLHDMETERDTMREEMGTLRQQLEEVMESIRTMLGDYTEVENDEKALYVISRLDKMQCDHAAYEERFRSEQEGFDIALAGREYEEIEIEAELLRDQLGDNVNMADGDFSSFDQALIKCRDELTAAREALAGRQAELSMMNTEPSEMSKLEEEIKLLSGRIDRYEFEYAALQEASDALSDAFESMQKDFGPMINFRASKILAELTGGRYSSVVVSESLTPAIKEPGGTIQSCISLSSGTVDQIYLALRLAIAGILSEENLPLMLDEAFAQFDDRRTAEALSYLITESEAERIGQVLVFTCHERVLKAAHDSGKKCSFIQVK